MKYDNRSRSSSSNPADLEATHRAPGKSTLVDGGAAPRDQAATVGKATLAGSSAPGPIQQRAAGEPAPRAGHSIQRLFGRRSGAAADQKPEREVAYEQPNGTGFTYKRSEVGTEASAAADHAGHGGSLAVTNTKDEKSLSASGHSGETSAEFSAKRTADGTEFSAAAEHAGHGGSLAVTNTKDEKSLSASGHSGETSAEFSAKRTADGTEFSAAAEHEGYGGSLAVKNTTDEKSLSASGQGAGYGGSLGVTKTKDDTEVSASGSGAGVSAGLVVSRREGLKELAASWASDLASVGGKITREGMALHGEYKIWSTSISIPVPGAPGLNIMIDPQVSVAGEGSGSWGGENKGNIDINAAVTGSVGVGASLGMSNVAEAYITGGPSVTGAFHYTRTAHAAPAADAEVERSTPAATQSLATRDAAPAQGASPKVPWTLVGSVNFKAGAEVGIKVLGGVINPTYQLGSLDVCTATGIYFDQTGFRRDMLGFEWGPQLTQMLQFFQSQWEPARRLGHKLDAKVERGKVKLSSAMSRGKRNVKLAFTSPKELLEKAKTRFGNRPDAVERGIDTMEEVVES